MINGAEEKRLITGRFLKVYSIYCEQVVGGRPYPKSSGMAAIYIDIFSYGNKPYSSKPFGLWHWKNTMILKVLAGNGIVLTDE